MDVVGSDQFGKKLAKNLGARFIQLELKTFPDGEVCPRITKKPGKKVILVHRMSYLLDPNKYLTELLLTLKTMKTSKPDLVIPYLIYSRQDKAFRPGESFSAKYVLQLLSQAGANRIFTVTPHTDIRPARTIDGFEPIKNYLLKLKLKRPLIIGPDLHMAKPVKKIAKALGCQSYILRKHRDLKTGKITLAGKPNAKGMDVVIVDDIVSSGSTLLQAIQILLKLRPKRILIAVVHNLANKLVMAKLSRQAKLLATDTIPTPVSKISVINQIAESL